MTQQILVPDIGDFKNVEVIDVLVKVGDRIEVDTPLITIETEKATMDVPSTVAGVIKSMTVKKGDRVSKGSLILDIEVEAGSKSAVATAQPTKQESASQQSTQIAAQSSSATSQPVTQTAA